jgi:hypothetical protein
VGELGLLTGGYEQNDHSGADCGGGDPTGEQDGSGGVIGSHAPGEYGTDAEMECEYAERQAGAGAQYGGGANHLSHGEEATPLPADEDSFSPRRDRARCYRQWLHPV